MKMNNTFVISYQECSTSYSAIYEGYLTPQDALKAFWESFDYDYRENVTDVKIYSLVKIEIQTDSDVIYRI